MDYTRTHKTRAKYSHVLNALRGARHELWSRSRTSIRRGNTTLSVAMERTRHRYRHNLHFCACAVALYNMSVLPTTKSLHTLNSSKKTVIFLPSSNLVRRRCHPLSIQQCIYYTLYALYFFAFASLYFINVRLLLSRPLLRHANNFNLLFVIQILLPRFLPFFVFDIYSSNKLFINSTLPLKSAFFLSFITQLYFTDTLRLPPPPPQPPLPTTNRKSISNPT